MIQKTAVGLIDTGIMTHLMDTHVLMLKEPTRIRNQPKLLNINDFVIYLEFYVGLCGFSVISFVVEMILNSKVFTKILKFIFLRKISKTEKVHFAKVHQDKSNKSCKVQKLTSNLIEKFRIEKLENCTHAFGEDVAESSNSKTEKQKVKEFESVIQMIVRLKQMDLKDG
jgi:hypothetical protein